jgi:hypothetical protein
MGRKKKRRSSQKRNVVQINMSVLPDEKVQIQANAKEAGMSVSNYLRMSIHLPPNLSRGNPVKNKSENESEEI